MSLYHFPRWTDALRPALGLAAVLVPTYVVVLFAYGASGETLNPGYAPEQPVPFSHQLHAGELGMDCRYCHYTVEDAAMAAIPPTQVCMNCHDKVWTESPKLAPVRESFATGEPVPWVRVHDLPEYAFFNHSAHVSAGVSCVDCHGRVDMMEVVRQQERLTMDWCLECHRNPEPNLRPKEHVFDLAWEPEEGVDRAALGAQLRKEHAINPRQDCSTCHR